MTTKPAQEDRRQYSRVAFDTGAHIIQADRQYKSQLLDISLNGVLLTPPKQYEINLEKPCAIEIHLSPDVSITMQVELIHNSHLYLGFRCISIDMDSVIHLRRLIENNLGDPDASDRVLAELLTRHQA